MCNPTAEELEREINSAGLTLTSKDNNKNRLRVKAWAEEHYPDLAVRFRVDKTAGRVEVDEVISRAEADEQAKNTMAAEAARRAEYLAKQRFFSRVKTRSGNEALYNSIENKLKKLGYTDRGVTISRSHSMASTLSFYVDDAENGVTIKISDHNTIGQQMDHNDAAFVDLHDHTSFRGVWSAVKAILGNE
nr:MAG TPA: hypothetical protein [Caudoviricetes sp.]